MKICLNACIQINRERQNTKESIVTSKGKIQAVEPETSAFLEKQPIAS